MWPFDDGEEDADLVDPQMQARAAGYSWGEIWDHVAGATKTALDFGYTEREVDQHLGYNDPAPAQARGQAQWANEVAANPKLVEDFGGPEPKLDLTHSQTLMSDYATALRNREAKGPRDFAGGYADAAMKAIGDTGNLADEVDLNRRQLAAQTAAQQLIPFLPTNEDLTDATLGVSRGVDPEIARRNLVSYWEDTGVHPLQAAMQAQQDPFLRDALNASEMPAIRPGSGYVPGDLHLDPTIAPPTKPGAARPFAPGEYISNPDGTWSSERTVTVMGNPDLNDGQPTVIPSLWLKDGKAYVAHNEDEAAQLAKESGLQFRTWGDLAAADEFSKQREEEWGLPKEARGKAPLYLAPEQTAATLEEISRPGRDAVHPVSMLGEPVEHKSILGDLADLGVTIAVVHGLGVVLRVGSKLVGSAIQSEGGQYVLQGLGNLLRDESGTLNMNPADEFVTAAVQNAVGQLGKARGAPHVDAAPPPAAVEDVKPIMDAMERDLRRIRGRAQDNQVAFMQLTDAMPKEYLTPELQAEAASIVESRMLKSPSSEAADETATRFLADMKPLTDRQKELGEMIASKTKGVEIDDPGLGIRSVEEGHMHRVLLGTGGRIPTKLDPSFEQEAITGANIGTRTMSKFAPGMQHRSLYVLENEEGQRVWGQVPLDRMRNPALTAEEVGQPFVRQKAQYGDELTVGDQKFTIKQATMDEVEANTDIRYRKNFLANTIEDVGKLERVNDNLDFLINRGKELAEKGLFIPKSPVSMGRQPEGMARVELPGMDGWAEPRIANVLNDYFNASRGDLAGFLTKASRFIVGSLFVSPVVHGGNVGAHWGVGRGWEWIKPSGYGALVKDGMEAVREVWTLGPRYRESLREGTGLLYAPTRTENFHNVLMTKLFHEQVADQGGMWSQFARGLGLKTVADLVRAEYRWSRKTLWAINDVFMLQRQFELQRQGLGLREAIFQAEKDIPSYNIPTEVMGSHAVSEFMKSPVTMNFGRYKYGQISALGWIVQDLAKGSTQDRIDAIGKLTVLGAISMFAYPALNAGLQTATNDPGWKVRGFGPFSLIDAVHGVASGEKEWASGVSSFLSMGPMVDILTKVTRNRDVWGREIVDHAASWQGKVIQGLEGVADQFYPSQMLMQGIKAGSPNKAIGGLLGATYKSPVDPAQQAKWDRRDERAAYRREQKDPIENFIRDHLDMPLAGGGGGDSLVARGERRYRGKGATADAILLGAGRRSGGIHAGQDETQDAILLGARTGRPRTLRRSPFGVSP